MRFILSVVFLLPFLRGQSFAENDYLKVTCISHRECIRLGTDEAETAEIYPSIIRISNNQIMVWVNYPEVSEYYGFPRFILFSNLKVQWNIPVFLPDNCTLGVHPAPFHCFVLSLRQYQTYIHLITLDPIIPYSPEMKLYVQGVTLSPPESKLYVTNSLEYTVTVKN